MRIGMYVNREEMFDVDREGVQGWRWREIDGHIGDIKDCGAKGEGAG